MRFAGRAVAHERVVRRGDVDGGWEFLVPALERPEVRAGGGRVRDEVERDELEIILDGDVPVLLLERRPPAAGHAELVPGHVQVAEHRARLGGENLDVPHEVVVLPEVVEHDVADVAEIQAAERGGVRLGVVELAQGAAVHDVRRVENLRLALEEVLRIHPPVAVASVRATEDACGAGARKRAEGEMSRRQARPLANETRAGLEQPPDGGEKLRVADGRRATRPANGSGMRGRTVDDEPVLVRG